MLKPLLHKPAVLMLTAALSSFVFLSLPKIFSQPNFLEDNVLGIRGYQTEFVFTNLKNKETLTVQQIITDQQPSTVPLETPQTATIPVVKTAPPKPTPPATKSQTQIWEEELVALTNQARTKNGLPPLSVDSQLVNIARKRASDMATKNYFDHTSPSGETAFTLLASAGITYKNAGENISKNTYPASQTTKIAFDTWMSSAPHQDNILSNSFTSIGIGAAISANGTKYYTQVFIGN